MNLFQFRHGIAALAALALTLGFATTSAAQSFADPNGEAPIGIDPKSDAKGPSLSGVLSLELVESNGLCAESAQMVVRLRRGPTILTFYATLAGPLFFETDEEKSQLQDAVLEAFRDDVLGGFFRDECGRFGTECPDVGLLLKKAEEFGLTNDGVAQPPTGACNSITEVANQFVILDVVVATSEPL